MKKLIALFVIVFVTVITLNAASMAIDSLTGPVTQNEVNSFKAYMATQVPPATPWGGGAGSHNAWADGPGGNNLEAMGLMYEITGDTTILTNLIGWTDRCVSERNDLLPASAGGQRVMWTGTISKVWVPNDPTSSSATYAGGENGDTKAHIAYTALLILQMPSLWNQSVPDGDPFGYGATYLARAKTYVLRCDEGHDDYDHIFYTSTNTVRNPPGWPSGFHTMEANNIQMMLLGYLERIAQCHEILNDNNASRIAKYDTIVKTASTECINGMKHSSTVNGDTVYKWGYYPWSTSFNESVGHAAYDMVGVYRAFNRSSYGFKLSSLKPFGNAVVDVMNVATNDFSGNVDGSGTTQNYMQAQWLLLGDWVPSVYDVIATADRASTRYKTTTLMEATILWMKDRRFREFSVDAGPASQGVVAGSAATFTATLAPLGGFGGTVNLSVSGLPAGATATFASPAVNLSTLNSPFTNVTVTISTTTSTPGGTYALTIIGASGSVSHSDVVNLAVTPAADFSVSATPSSQTVVVGSSTTYTVNVGSINGFNSAVNLAVSGLPAGATATFNPA
ncbi:MAG TPA: hypothetical protein VN625_08960, partial [Desulfuromonadaceae bacterium]|nr:hypothetical protein [Desulfuromonadaceae bacterium]